VCDCGLRYPACNGQSPYCHLWPTRLYSIFPHYVINGTTKTTITEYKMFWFSLQLFFFWNVSHSKKSWGMIKNSYWSSCKIPVIPARLWRNSTDVRKTLKYQISWKSFQWKPSCSMRTNRPTWLRNPFPLCIASNLCSQIVSQECCYPYVLLHATYRAQKICEKL